MGVEPVRGTASTQGAGVKSSAPFSYTEIFERQCAEFMAMGMSYDEYWNQDVLIAKYYKKAYELKRETKNYDAWLQGRYIYDALICVSPILRALSSATEPIPYHEEPYALSLEEAEKREKEEEKKRVEKSRTAIMNMVAEANKRILEKGDNDVKS